MIGKDSSECVCFKQEIIQWSGCHSNHFERLKATMVSLDIR